MLKKKSLTVAAIAVLLVLSTSLSCVIEIVLPAEPESQPGLGSQPGPGPQPEPGPEPGPIAGSESNMNRDEKIATVTTGGQGAILQGQGIKVEFSGKALPPGVTVNAYSVKDAEKNYPGGWLKLAGPVFDIDIGGQVLGDLVRVTLPYDAAKLGSADPKSLFGVTWNGVKWDPQPSTVDAANRTVSFLADHFSEVSTGGERLILTYEGYGPPAVAQSDKYTTTHFTISYKKDGPDMPLFDVQNLGVFLEDAYTRIGAMGYNMPPPDRIITVRICAQPPGVYGTCPVIETLRYAIYIDNQMDDPTGKLPDSDQIWQRLKDTAGHELFHVVQDYNPGFPFWFYEASAAFMCWRLYQNELPTVVAEYFNVGSGGADFLYRGFDSSVVADQYAWALFLIYLQQQYGTKCSGSAFDILKDGIFPSGGAWIGRKTSSFVSTDMSQAFLNAAQKCGGFTGTWHDLLTEFAKKYYVEHDKWPGLGKVVNPSSGEPLERSSVIYGWPANDTDPTLIWNVKLAPRPETLPTLQFPSSSAALWMIRAQDDIVGTLVLRMDEKTSMMAVPQMGVVVESAPEFWIYRFRGIHQKMWGNPIGPIQFSGKNPTVAVPDFCEKDENQVSEVCVLGVDSRSGRGLGTSCTLKGYLLPPPKGLTTERMQVTEDGKQVDKLRVSWAVDSRWVNSAISKEFGGFTHEVRDSSGKVVLTSIPVEQGNSVDIIPQPNMTTISVVLLDSYKNEGPSGIVEIEAPSVSLILDTNMPDPGEPNQPYTFTATPSITPPAGCFYKWYDCGTLQDGTGSSNSISFNEDPSLSVAQIIKSHTVRVELIYDGQVIASATKDVNIKAKLEAIESTPAPSPVPAPKPTPTPKPVPATGATRQRVDYCLGTTHLELANGDLYRGDSSSPIHYKWTEIKLANGDWARNGLWTSYFCPPLPHNVSHTCPYVNGKENGLQEDYYTDGKHADTVEWVNGDKVKITSYDSKGRPYEICTKTGVTWPCVYPKYE